MTWLLENPWPAIVGTLLAESLLAAALYATGKAKIGIAMGIVLLLGLALVLVERFVVTETEEVEDTLQAVAAALETNDLAAVMAFLAGDASNIRAAAQNWLPQAQITAARVGSDLRITFGEGADPLTAEATFTGRISRVVNNPQELLPYREFVQKFTLDLRKEGDRWLLTDYAVGGLPDAINFQP